MRGAIGRSYLSATALSLLLASFSSLALADPLPRSGEAAGAVIARKSGEEVRFIDVSDWRTVDLKQDLLTGDVLRTNETGQLAIVFSDRTQIRLGRNSSLVVKQITANTSADTVLQLQSGSIWARAERGGSGVRIETPAAAAAIRGTDWTMTVKGEQTSLNVLEGNVELSNPQGRVDVRQGEGAVAAIGQAPRKIVIVQSDDREQMLFYLPPREAFDRMPPSAQPVAEMRRSADRISAIPASQRSVEQWVTLAEVQLSLEGRAKARETLAILNGKHLSSAEQSRVMLVDAVLLAAENRFAEAAGLFEKAQRGLDAKRRGIALYGGYYARALANPSHVEKLPPRVGGPDSAFLRAYAIGFLKDLKSAIQEIREAERRFPDDAQLPAYRGWLALLLNDRIQAKEALDRALSIDPSEPTALEGRSNFRAGFLSDNKGALADVQAAMKITPGSSGTWNALAGLQAERGAIREAEAALRKAIELDPNSPVVHANLAIFYLDLGRMEDARREIDIAMAVDPAFDIALIARGRYYLQTGQTDKAIDDLLAGTVANPAYSQGALMLGAAHYAKGDRVAAGQAIDNADRLDKNDPVISAVRTAVAINDYDSDGAIRSAQEYLRRSRARGGDYSSIGANQQAGSTLNAAFRLQGLNAWGEYYSDASFEPFSGAAYIDQGIRGSANPFANNYDAGDDIFNNTTNGQSFSSIFQGLLLEPSLVSSRSRRIEILPSPFFEGSLGGGINTAGGKLGHVANAEIQSYSNEPFPISFSGSLEWQKIPDSRNIGALANLGTENRILGGNAYLTASPTIYDRTVFYFNRSRNEARFNGQNNVDVSPLFLIPGPVLAPLTLDQSQSSLNTNAGLGWSHTVEYQNVVNAALLYNRADSRSSSSRVVDLFGLPVVIDTTESRFEQETFIGALNHTVGSGDLVWRYGIEGGWTTSDTFQRRDDFTTAPPMVTTASLSSRTSLARAYVDLRHEINANLRAEYALFATSVSGGGTDIHSLDPRIGIAWSPAEGQWLRAGFIRNSVNFSTPTLSPIGVAGLQPNQIATGPEGYTNTLALRWDAEWTPDFFTAMEFQHQDIRDPQIGIPLAAAPFTTSEGRIDRGSLSTNLFLGHGFGLSSAIAYTSSKDEGPASVTFGRPLPFVPQWTGQLALTWVNEANIKASLAANYVGKRNNEIGARLDDYWTLNANLTWEPFDKAFEMELAVYNLLNERFDVNTGASGWGRTFKGTIKVRF